LGHLNRKVDDKRKYSLVGGSVRNEYVKNFEEGTNGRNMNQRKAIYILSLGQRHTKQIERRVALFSI